MNKITEALELAEAYIAGMKWSEEADKALAAVREALAEQALQNLSDFHQYMEATEPKCSKHPDAPHGFDRNASHNADRYVCECEGWEPPEQEPVAVVEITYGREPECYVTGNINNFPEGVFKLYAAPVDAKAIRECRNPKADEVRAYRDEHSVSMKQAYEKVKLDLNAKAEKAGIKFIGGFVRVAEFVTEDELLELSKAIRAEAFEEAAVACDKVSLRFFKDRCDLQQFVSDQCAAAIRGLK